jgi:hypothetical protein
MMDIVFLITTYNRHESCQRLVDALQGQGDIVVVNDGCDYVINGCKQHFLDQHNGKTYYWMTVKALFALRGQHKYYFMLPDDFLTTENMVENALTIWKSIYDPQKICLNLYADRVGIQCWTHFTPRDMGNIWQTQWVDMCFLCEERFFSISNSIEVHNSAGKRNMGSGVGCVISRQLNKMGFSLYQVKESLAIPTQEHYLNTQMQRYDNVVPYDAYKRIRNRRQKIVSDTREMRHR